jgi:hypothetical protein
MTKKLLFIGSIGLFAIACGGNTATVNTNATANVANTTVNAPANTANVANTTNTANANKPANATAAKPAESGPKRVSFKKGEVGSTQSISLASGASMQFVLGATGAQNLYVTPASQGLTFKMLKGIGGDFSKGDDGMYSAETKGNNGAKGDILFEVKNTTAKEIKTSIKIEIEDFGD